MPPHTTFAPYFVKRKTVNPPKINLLREEFIHSLLRFYLSKPTVLKYFLGRLGVKEFAESKWEVLGERALERGYVDLLIKEAEPHGEVKQIVIEVKSNDAGEKDVKQLSSYMEEIGEECIAGAVIAKRVSKGARLVTSQNMYLWRYEFEGITLDEPHTFEELLSKIRLSPS